LGVALSVYADCCRESGRRFPRSTLTPRLRIEMTCDACATENAQGAKFCSECGAALTGSPSAPQLEERKVVSVLFCDVVGFTSRSESADPEDVLAAMRPFYAYLRKEIEGHGGVVEKFIGDAVMAVFGAPVAHEDDAERAVRSGLAILQGIEALNAEEHFELAVRIGINTGETVVALGARVTEGEGIVLGDVVNTAARIQTAAPVGAVVVGASTYHVTQNIFEYEALEPVLAKGKKEPVVCWRAISAPSRLGSEITRRTAAPFIGRSEDLALIQNLFSRAVRDRTVQLVTILGEPGVGKSRLVMEFSRYVEERREPVAWRSGRCLSYGEGITFWALGEIIKSEAGIFETDDAATAKEKLERSISQEEADRDWMLARVGTLLGLEAPPAEREESFTAWRRFLEQLASRGPAVFVVEDIHWADESMLAFWEHFASWCQDLPIMVVTTARPEVFERYPTWTAGIRNATTIALGPLGEAETQELVDALVSNQMNQTITDQIAARCGGNPLFAEEFARMLAERAADEADVFPDTVQSLIAARIDTLKPDRKALLQDASVIGHVFWSGALATVGDRELSEVRKALHELSRKELIRPLRTSSMQGEEEFSFWHSLVADVAYALMPRATRARKHLAVASWIESGSGARVADTAELVAEHHLEALRLMSATGAVDGASREAARARLGLAAEVVGERDPARRQRYLRSALELDPPQRERAWLLVELAGDLLTYDGRWQEGADLAREAAALSRDLGDVEGEGRALAGLSQMMWSAGDGEGSKQAIEASVDVLRRAPDSEERCRSLWNLAQWRGFQGDLDGSIQIAEEALALAETHEFAALTVELRVFRTEARCHAGRTEDLSAMTEAAAWFRDVGSTRGLIGTLVNHGELLWLTQGPVAAIPLMEEGAAIGEGRGFRDGVPERCEILGPLFDLGRLDDLLATAARVVDWADAHKSDYYSIRARPWAMIANTVIGIPADADDVRALISDALRVGEEQIMMPALAAAALSTRDADAVGHVRAFHERSAGRASWRRTLFLPEMIRIALANDDAALAEALIDGTVRMYERGALAEETARALIQEHRGDLRAARAAFSSLAERWHTYGHVREEELARAAAERCS
jgi:class 3 adenylate cyclase/tetratricopeptide (TPR) repeat protein